MENFGLNQKIDGMNVVAYISAQLERIEKAEVSVEKEKIKNSYLKQLNNNSRLRLDAAKFLQKKAEFEYSCLLREKKLEAK